MAALQRMGIRVRSNCCRRAVELGEELLDPRVLRPIVAMNRVVVGDRSDVLRLIPAKFSGHSIENPQPTVTTESS